MTHEKEYDEVIPFTSCFNTFYSFGPISLNYFMNIFSSLFCAQQAFVTKSTRRFYKLHTDTDVNTVNRKYF